MPDGRNRVNVPIVLDAGKLRQASLKRPVGFLRVLIRGIGARIKKVFRSKQ